MRTRLTTISGKIEMLVLALVCMAAVLLMPMEVQAGKADNSLASLTVDEGTLSPQFEGSRLNYTVAVSVDTTSVTVNAKTVNPNAKILSGVGITTLNDSEDTKIRILVEAENGNQATYTITVSKSGTPAAGSDNQIDNPEGGNNNTPDTPDEQSFIPEGYSISEDFAAEDIPAGFQEAEVEYDGSTVRGASFINGDLKLLYLTDASGAGEFYVRDILDLYPLIRVGTEENYIFLLHVPAYSSDYPGTPTQIPVGDQIFDEAFPTELDDIYQVYGMDQSGNEGFFSYNTAAGTYEAQDASGDSEDSTEDTPDANEYLQKAYDELNQKYTDRKDRDMKIIAVLIVVIVILIFVIVNLLLHGGRRGDMEDEEDIFEEKTVRKGLGRRKKDTLEEEEPDRPDDLTYDEKAEGVYEKESEHGYENEKSAAPQTEPSTETAGVAESSAEASMDALLRTVTASRQNAAALAAEQPETVREAERIPSNEQEKAPEPDVLEERPWSDDEAFTDFDEDPDFFGGRKAKKEKKKKEKREKKRRSGDIFDDVEEDEGIFGNRNTFADSEPTDEDEIEVMDLNDL